MLYKGKILLIGGGEYRGPHLDEIEETNDDGLLDEYTPLETLLDVAGEATIEVVTTGTAYPRESFARYENYFKNKGVREVSMLDIDSRYLKPEQLERAQKATAIFFGGGNQRKILEILKDTEFDSLLKKRLKEDENFIVGGTSAGTMILSELTIGDGFEKSKLIKGDVDIRSGLNILPGIITDTHFLESMRLSRLTLALLENRKMLGIGLSENCGILIREGNLIETVGDEVALLLDASEVTDTNVKEANKGDTLFAMNTKLHFLSKGVTYSISERKLVG